MHQTFSSAQVVTAYHLAELARAQNYKLTGPQRSGVLHDLMDEACRDGNEYLWSSIAEVLVRACDADDLTPQVSDHFVRDAPDEVFKAVARKSPYSRYTYWRKRAQTLSAE